jgi:putative SOS response-associated peptidase YedK
VPTVSDAVEPGFAVVFEDDADAGGYLPVAGLGLDVAGVTVTVGVMLGPGLVEDLLVQLGTLDGVTGVEVSVSVAGVRVHGGIVEHVFDGRKTYSDLMCGRFAMNKKVDQIAQDYVDAGGQIKNFMDWYQASISLAPTDEVPIVREAVEDGTIVRELGPARWDFRPQWRGDKRPVINARWESLVEGKPMFRKALLTHRAVVPMTGYFEWTGPPKDKTPHFVSAGGELLSAAGLYTFRKVEETGEWETSCVVITRPGVDAAGEVHDRMPAFLTPDVLPDWLAPTELEDKGPLLAMLDHSSATVAASLESWVVDRKVNNSRTVDTRDASLLEPVKD